MTYSPYLKLSILICIFVLCCFVSLLIGDQGLEWQSISSDIFREIRLPHTLNAVAIGGLLALAGFLMQGMLSNPLVDPYTLGTSGGAAVFTMVAMILGLQGIALIGASFLGALLTLFLLMILVGRVHQTSSSKLLLIGVVLAAGWGALLSLMLIIAPSLQTKTLLYWLFGDIDYLHYPMFALGCLLVTSLLSYRWVDDLQLLSQGFTLAKTLGVNANKLQVVMLVLSSLMTATAVSVGGTIGFIGLIVPHCARFLLKRYTRLIIPFTILLGATLLVSADILARIAIAPEQLPIGVITTLVGIPTFLYLAKKHYG